MGGRVRLDAATHCPQWTQWRSVGCLVLADRSVDARVRDNPYDRHRDETGQRDPDADFPAPVDHEGAEDSGEVEQRGQPALEVATHGPPQRRLDPLLPDDHRLEHEVRDGRAEEVQPVDHDWNPRET